jgi:integrase
VADAEEAAILLAALDPADAVPYALAFYSGLRRAEIRRLDWPDVQLDGYRLIVRKAKTQAGTGRRPPIAEPLRDAAAVSAVSVMSGKLAERARKRWAAADLKPITLHECRHTYASSLMAAGYTLRELMEYTGHSSLQATERDVKLVPPLDEPNPSRTGLLSSTTSSPRADPILPAPRTPGSRTTASTECPASTSTRRRSAGGPA